MLKEILILSGPDIEKLITMPSALRIAEQAFRAYGQRISRTASRMLI